MSKTIEYRVRPVTRYIVTRFYREEFDIVGGDKGYAGGSSCFGEFDCEEMAINLCALLTKTEPGAVLLDGFGETAESSWVDEILERWKR